MARDASASGVGTTAVVDVPAFTAAEIEARDADLPAPAPAALAEFRLELRGAVSSVVSSPAAPAGGHSVIRLTL